MTSKRKETQCNRCKQCKCQKRGGKKKNYAYAEHVKAYAKMKRRMDINACRNYQEYEQKRREEPKRKRLRIKKLREMILADYPKMTESDVARFICIIDMVFRNNSLRRHVEYMYDHLGSVNAYDLDKVPSKSGLHDWVQWFADMKDWVHELILKQAGEDAHGTLLGDSSGFSIMKYEDWEYAKKGIISRRGFDKLHILLSPHGMIVAFFVTGGRSHDSPIFRKMYKQWIPQGTGHVMLDAAYPCKANCNMIRGSGRIPVICPKSNMKPKGFNALAEMLRWHQDDHEGFEKIYHQRSLVETAFSVIKERFGANARAKLENVRALLLGLKCICYNLVS